MTSCTASAIYVAGEKVPLQKYAILRFTGTEWVRVLHWREMPEDAETVLVLPEGTAHDPDMFRHASWSAKGDKRTAKGSRGRSGAHTWDDAFLLAVTVTRAHGISVAAPGAAAARDLVIDLLESGAASEDLARACIASSDPLMSKLALASVVLSRDQLRSLALSHDEVLRSRAARYTKESSLLSRLLRDENLVVRQTAARNPHLSASALARASRDATLTYEIASNPSTTEEVALDIIELGGIEARAAITNPNVAARANRALKVGSHLDVFAARNPALDTAVALLRSKESPAVAAALASNSSAVGRLSQDQALDLVNILLANRSFESIADVCRYARFTPEVQMQLLTRHFGDQAMLGLAGSAHLDRDAAEMILDSSALVPEGVRSTIQTLLAENARTPVRVLSALEMSHPSVARSLSRNDRVSSTIRATARQAVLSYEASANERLQEVLSNPGAPQAREWRTLADPLASRARVRPVAALALSDDALERSMAVPPEWGLHAWGGKRLEIEASLKWYESTAYHSTRVVLRVDERQAKKTSGTNITVDPLGVVVEQDGESYFALLTPVRSSDPIAPTLVKTAVEADELETPGLFAAMGEAASRIDKRTIATRAVAKLPIVGHHVGKVRLAAQLHKTLSGAVDGLDRVAHLPVDASRGGLFRVLEPENRLEEAFQETFAFVSALHTADRITAQERDAVTIALSKIEEKANSTAGDHALAIQYRDMLRFRVGQVHVVERLLQEDIEWLI